MKNLKMNLFFEKNLVWKNGPETPSSSASGSLEDGRSQYFQLREYLRANYKKLDKRVSDRMAEDPANGDFSEVKAELDKVCFDDRFDPNTISKEDMKKVAESVLTGGLEFFYNDQIEKGVKLSRIAVGIRNVFANDIGRMMINHGTSHVLEGVLKKINKIDVVRMVNNVDTSYVLEELGTVKTVKLEIMETPQIQTLYNPKTARTTIAMMDTATGDWIYKKDHAHPLPNEISRKATFTEREVGTVKRVGGVEVMATPSVEKIYDSKSSTITLKFSNPLGGKPFWTKTLEAKY